MTILAAVALVMSLITLGASLLAVTGLKGMKSFLLLPKLTAASRAAWVAPLGLVACGLGLFSGSLFLVGLNLLLGGVAAFLSVRYIARSVAPHTGFETAFGADWRDRIEPELHGQLPQRRWPIYRPDAPQPRWERDVVFATVPGTERKLLCDLWFPLSTAQTSHLAVIYMHGSGWCLLDKDAGTRPFFKHLCAQGHFVMDVAYRLAPETDMAGMVGDVKRAVAWLKTHAAEYGINLERIVLGGGSAGGHIALLAGYTPHFPALTPEDVARADISVRAVFSYYGPTDLRAFYHHSDWGRLTSPGSIIEKVSHSPLLQSMKPKDITAEQMNFEKGLSTMLHLFPGAPDEAPEWYTLFSPIEYIQADCPATLLLYGGDDFLVPPAAARSLDEKLRAVGVPSVCVVFPQADHAFDMASPQWAPAAQASYYDLDHFLALMV